MTATRPLPAAVAELVPTRVGPLYVRSVGAGPPTLLWHSLFVDGHSWDRLVAAFPGERRWLVVDGPGHGASPGPGHRFTLDDCAAAAVEVLDAVGIGAVDWVGNAWGGHVGHLVAARDPERVTTLTAIAAPLVALPAGQRRKVAPLVALYPLLGPRSVAPKVVETLLTASVRDHDAEAVALVTTALRRPARRALQRSLRAAMLERPDLRWTAAAATCPTLLVVGDDDPLWTAEDARRLDGAGDGVVVIEGSRHLAPVEAPTALAAVLDTFWSDAGVPLST